MAVAKKKTAGLAPSDLVGPEDEEARTPVQSAAREILTLRADLLPSVERIVGAGLSDDGTVAALGLFRDSLTEPGDPNRDPKVAIANAGE